MLSNTTAITLRWGMLSLLAFLFFSISLSAQLQIDSLNKAYLIDFDKTVNGVNNGAYNGSGLDPSPATGQLDGDAWEIIGSGTFNNSTTSPSGANGGVYGFEVSTGNRTLGVQTDNSNFNTTGDGITLLVENTTGSNISQLTWTGDVLEYDNGNKEVDVYLQYSEDKSNWIPLSNFTTARNTSSSSWVSNPFNHTFDVSIANLDVIYLKVGIVGPPGNNGDALALNDFSLTAEPYTFTCTIGSWDRDPSGIAGDADSILVESGDAVITATASVRYAEVAPGSSLSIAAGESLSVVDSLVLNADASGYAQLIGEVSGTTRWESFLESATARWFNVAVPVNTTLDALHFTSGGFLQTGGGSTQDNIYYYNAQAISSGDGEGTWTPVSSLSDNASGRGYSIYLGAPYFGNLPMKLAASGQVFNGDVTISITPSASTPPNLSGWGWNFVANPYPSALDWSAVVANTGNENLSTIYWILDDESGKWVAYNESADPILPTGNGGGKDTITSRYIAPGQAFFIQSVSTTQDSIVFQNGDRVVAEKPVKKSSLTTAPNSVTFWVTDQSTQNQDYNWLGFEAGATDGLDDRREGLKRMNDKSVFPALYYTQQGNNLIFNFVSDAFTSRTYPLNFEYDHSGSFAFEAALKNLHPAWSVLLEDKITGQFTDLRQSAYNFQHDPANNKERFIVHFSKTGVGVSEEVLASDIYSYWDEENLVVSFGENTCSTEVQVDLLDMQGRQLKTSSGLPQQGKYSLEVSELPAGVYLLRVKAGGKEFSLQKALKP